MAGKRIVQARFFTGPNLYADHSVLLVETDFGVAPERLLQPTPLAPAAATRLGASEWVTELAWQLDLALEALPRGVATIDLILDIAARVQHRHVIRGAVGRVVGRGPGTLSVVVPAESEELGFQAWVIAVSAVNLLLASHVDARALAELEALGRKHLQSARQIALAAPTMVFARRARELDIPVYRLAGDVNRIQLGQGRFSQLAEKSLLEPFSSFAVTHIRNKWATVRSLRQMGLPTLASALATSEEQAVAAAAEMNRAVVVKPAANDKGVGISLDLRESREVRAAYRLAAQSGPWVLVEEFGPGDDHRILVVDGRMIACARRVPAQVTGDGRRTIGELIDAVNADPRRGTGSDKVLEKIEIDARLRDLLARRGLAVGSVPRLGQQVVLSLAANVSQGGTAVDVTDRVHPDNREAAERAARVLRVKVAGIDFLTPDITRSWRDGSGWILEVNAPVGLRPHWIANPAQDVVTPIVRASFPEGTTGRIPTAAITGSLGKTTTCQMLATIAKAAGHTTGLATTQGIWSGGFCIDSRDWSSGAAAQRLLTDPTIDLGIFELARGALAKGGMVIEDVEVAAVLNVLDNHVGLDGIVTREQMAAVKSIVVRAARHAVVLNADDPLVLAMRGRAKAAVTLASRNPTNGAVARHRDQGGCVAVLEQRGGDAVIRLIDRHRTVMEQPLRTIPAAHGGRSRAITTNALFAVAIAHHLGLAEAAVHAGLGRFTSDAEQNPGRHNCFAGFPFQLVLNWADGAVALAEMVGWACGEVVVGKRRILLTSPGNRSDDWVRALGRAAAGHFDLYYCADMETTLRGRKLGVVPALIAQGLRNCGVPESAIVCLASGSDSVRILLESANPGDQVILATYETKDALRQIDAFRRGQPVMQLPNVT